MPDWLTINWGTATANLIALLALGVALWSAWISRKALKLEEEKSAPVVSLEISLVPDQIAGWRRVFIDVRNPAPYPISLVRLELVKPRRNSGLLSNRDGSTSDSFNAMTNRRPLPAGPLVRMLGLTSDVAPTNHHREGAFLFVEPSSRPVDVELRLHLLTSEPVSRRSVLALRRQLHDTTRIVTD